MNGRVVEVSAIVLASVVAAFSSIVGLKTLWEIQVQSSNSEFQLAEIQKQSDILQAQLRVNEALISNDSALTFLQLLEAMRPRWSLDVTHAAMGKDDGFENYEKDAYVVQMDITNTGRSPLVVSKQVRVGMYSCITGRQIMLGVDGEEELTDVESDAKDSVQNRILARTATIQPGETGTVWFYKDIIQEENMATELFGKSGEYLLSHSALVYAEGSETVANFVGDVSQLEPYFELVAEGENEVRAPFLTKTLRFNTWLISDGYTIVHSLETDNCSTDQLDDRFLRANRQ